VPKPPTITDSEWLVMQVLWQHSPLTAAEITDALLERTQWSSSTVKTLLTRLAHKSALRHTQSGNRYLYEPAVKETACVRAESRSFLDRVFGGAALPAVEHFVRHERLTEEERDRIRALLDEQEQNP